MEGGEELFVLVYFEYADVVGLVAVAGGEVEGGAAFGVGVDGTVEVEAVVARAETRPVAVD